MWSRQADRLTRARARAVASVTGNAGILRRLDVAASAVTDSSAEIVDDASFMFVDGNFAVIGHSLTDYDHVSVGSRDVAVRRTFGALHITPRPTPIAMLDSDFMAAIDGSENHLPAGEDWYLVPVPLGITPIVIQGKEPNRLLVSGIDFTAHPGYIAMRYSPAEVLPTGLVRIVTGTLDVPRVDSYVISAPTDRRGGFWLSEYARKTQSLSAFKKAAAEYCGMFVFDAPDFVLGSHPVPGGVVYVMASRGTVRIDYPHTALRVGGSVEKGHIVARRFEFLNASNYSRSIMSSVLDTGASISLDGVLAVKGLSFSPGVPVLADYVNTSPEGKPHVRLHLSGALQTLQEFWGAQQRHERATGNYLFDDIFTEGEVTKEVFLEGLLVDYYGGQIVLVVVEAPTAEMGSRLATFVATHHPANVVVLMAALPTIAPPPFVPPPA